MISEKTRGRAPTAVVLPLAFDPRIHTMTPAFPQLDLVLTPDADATEPDGTPLTPGVRHVRLPAGQPEPALLPLVAGEQPLFALGERVGRYQVALRPRRGGKQQQVTLLQRGSGRSLFRAQIYLFHVLVAIEWQPSEQTLHQIAAGFRAAADFLFDATDGQMTFGQVTIGGADLMPIADFQILASTRLHPRSWVDGFNTAHKYTPIRVGRGLWNKQQRSIIGWEHADAYHTLIHEWSHYALNLVDEYLNNEQFVVTPPVDGHRLLPVDAADQETAVRVVTPRVSLPVESIMARLDGPSELVPEQWRGWDPAYTIAQRIGKHYPGVSFVGPEDPGPSGVPAHLPRVFCTEAITTETAEERLIAVDPLHAEGLGLAHCWAYLLRGDPPTRIVPQGTFDQRAWTTPGAQGAHGLGFTLLGYQPGDTLLVIGDQRTPDGGQRLAVRRIVPAPATGDAAAGRQGAWLAYDATDDVTPATAPLVTVIPVGNIQENVGVGPSYQVQVRVHGGAQPDGLWLAQMGGIAAPQPLVLHAHASIAACWESDVVDVTTLDGQILLHWSTGSRVGGTAWLVADYSQGGGPKSHVHAPQSPVSAGSSEGNLMLFFHDAGATRDLSDLRVVTTRNYAGAPGAARSYLFGLAASGPIPVQLDPTLVLYYDRDAISSGGELLICRSNAAVSWEPAPTFQQPGTYLAAWPLRLGAADAGGQILSDGAVEYVQLRLVHPAGER